MSLRTRFAKVKEKATRASSKSAPTAAKTQADTNGGLVSGSESEEPKQGSSTQRKRASTSVSKALATLKRKASSASSILRPGRKKKKAVDTSTASSVIDVDSRPSSPQFSRAATVEDVDDEDDFHSSLADVSDTSILLKTEKEELGELIPWYTLT